MPVERDAVRRAWDAVSETYATNRRADGPDADLIDELLADLPAGATVLDVGCGDGERTLSSLLDGTGAIGLDFSRRGLELARGNVPGARLVQADMTAVPLGAGTVDAITAYHAVFHVPRAEHPAVYREFERVLRPGGKLLMTVGTSRHEGTRSNWLDSGHPMFWSTAGKAETYSQLRKAGFAIAAERTVDDPLGSEASFVFAETES
jgi:ubiquinone/menaquinone biosynthesis C-methylase UbiE